MNAHELKVELAASNIPRFDGVFWSHRVRDRVPARVADKLVVAVRYNDEILVLMKGRVNNPIVFALTDDFPTELDVARLCVECP